MGFGFHKLNAPDKSRMLAVEQDGAFADLRDARHHVEKRRLPGAVGSDQADHLAGGELDGHPLQCGHSAVAQDDVARLQCVFGYVRCHRPARPRGTKMMKISSSAPVVTSR